MKTSFPGLPQSAINAARKSAQSKGIDGWRFTLQGPSIISILTHLDDRSIRESIYKRYNARATVGETDNRERLGAILKLRHKKAQLLGYDDVSDLFLDGRMVQNGASAQSFVEDLCSKTRDAARQEHESLVNFSIEECDVTYPLQPWDIGYFAEKQRKALYDFDEEEVRPYLSVGSVLSGLFELANKLFGSMPSLQTTLFGTRMFKPLNWSEMMADFWASFISIFFREKESAGRMDVPLENRGLYATR